MTPRKNNPLRFIIVLARRAPGGIRPTALFITTLLLLGIGVASPILFEADSTLVFADTTQQSACSVSVALGSNLIANGDAEANLGAGDEISVVAPDCWTTTGHFTSIRYGVNGFPVTGTIPNGGLNFFGGGPNSAISTATQVINVETLSPAIDTGDLSATLSGFLGVTSSKMIASSSAPSSKR